MNDADFGFFLVNDLLQTSEIYFSCSFQKIFFLNMGLFGGQFSYIMFKVTSGTILVSFLFLRQLTYVLDKLYILALNWISSPD